MLRTTPLNIRPRSSCPVNKVNNNTGRENLNQYSLLITVLFDISRVTMLTLNSKANLQHPTIRSL